MRGGQGSWLIVLLVAVAAQPTLSYLLMGLGVPGGFTAGMVIGSIGVVIALVLWVAQPLRWEWSRWEWVFLLGLLAVWAVTMGSSVLKGNVFTHIVAWLPIAVTMILLKRPSLPDVRRAVDAFGWVLVCGMAAFLLLELLGVIDHRVPVVSTEYELRTYWLPFSDLLDLPGRWAGPFAHPNLTSPVAAFLVVYGLARGGSTRIAFVTAGVLVLLLTGTRSAMVAVLLGVLVLAVTQSGWLRSRRHVWMLAGASAVALLGLVIGFLLTNPTLEGRTAMWPKFLSLWSQSPLTGVGDPGVTLAIQAEVIPSWAVHGHNVLVDPIVRYGIPAALLVLLVLIAAAVVTIRGALTGSGVGLSILVTVVVCGALESTLDWRYLTVQMSILLVSVLLIDRRPAASEA